MAFLLDQGAELRQDTLGHLPELDLLRRNGELAPLQPRDIVEQPISDLPRILDVG